MRMAFWKVRGTSDSEACHHGMGAFIERFREDPNAFDARRDGVDFMQEMRRHHPRHYALGPRAAVGGFVTILLQKSVAVSGEP